MYATPIAPDHAHRVPYSNSAPRVGAAVVLPTPDPTIASCISDEDVAMQLIRLGDASNFSHGRTSASTVDDAFSGAADAASSMGATSDGEDFSEDEDNLPTRRRLDSSPMLPPGAIKRQHKRLDDILPSADSSDHSSDGVEDGIKSEDEDDALYKESATKSKKPKNRPVSAKPRSQKPMAKQSKSKSAAPRKPSDKSVGPLPPLSPNSARKVSGGSVNVQLGADEEDLSTKPRCQRCRKSKKGCDRQRPCGRCKDAGIGIEGCVSEDEGNGRKGRYGRHMGVPVKKPADSTHELFEIPPMSGTPLTAADNADKNKKRKR